MKVTAGVAVFGAVAGAVAGGLSAILVGAVMDGSFRQLFDGFLFLIGAEIGAPLGAVFFPIAAWTLMRHVPFGRAFVGVVAGTLIGGFAGWFMGGRALGLVPSIGGGTIGFAIAAVLLRLRARRAQS